MQKRKPELLRESSNLTVQSVDREAGVIHGVKLAGITSRNGRTYPESVLAKARPLYEGVSVFVNHSPDNSPRDYRDHIADVRNVVASSEGLRGDLHLKQAHPLYEQILEDAEKKRESVGMSHAVMGHSAREGKTVVVEEITAVESVDLVANPATTSSLFEQADNHNNNSNNHEEDNTMRASERT